MRRLTPKQKLPNADRCEVAEAKITRYLLNLESEHGASKAQFFLAFGFTIAAWEVMAAALRVHAQTHLVKSIVPRPPYGMNYVIEGTLETPDQRNPYVRTIWAIDSGGQIPRLVSAYPGKEEANE